MKRKLYRVVVREVFETEYEVEALSADDARLEIVQREEHKLHRAGRKDAGLVSQRLAWSTVLKPTTTMPMPAGEGCSVG